MALPDLATTADLVARGMSTVNSAPFLSAASAAVRDAAGVPITLGTFTFDVAGSPEQYLPLPASPIVSVASVAMDGTPITDFKLVSGRLWRRCGWADVDPFVLTLDPSVVTVTQTCGLDTVPADIVDLVCSLVGLAMAKAEDGSYSSRGDLTQLRIDDYGEAYDSSSAGRLAGVLELPDATRTRLRSRFGCTAGLVRFQ